MNNEKVFIGFDKQVPTTNSVLIGKNAGIDLEPGTDGVVIIGNNVRSLDKSQENVVFIGEKMAVSIDIWKAISDTLEFELPGVTPAGQDMDYESVIPCKRCAGHWFTYYENGIEPEKEHCESCGLERVILTPPTKS